MAVCGFSEGEKHENLRLKSLMIITDRAEKETIQSLNGFRHETRCPAAAYPMEKDPLAHYMPWSNDTTSPFVTHMSNTMLADHPRQMGMGYDGLARDNTPQMERTGFALDDLVAKILEEDHFSFNGTANCHEPRTSRTAVNSYANFDGPDNRAYNNMWPAMDETSSKHAGERENMNYGVVGSKLVSKVGALEFDHMYDSKANLMTSEKLRLDSHLKNAHVKPDQYYRQFEPSQDRGVQTYSQENHLNTLQLTNILQSTFAKQLQDGNSANSAIFGDLLKQSRQQSQGENFIRPMGTFNQFGSPVNCENELQGSNYIQPQSVQSFQKRNLNCSAPAVPDGNYAKQKENHDQSYNFSTTNFSQSNGNARNSRQIFEHVSNHQDQSQGYNGSFRKYSSRAPAGSVSPQGYSGHNGSGNNDISALANYETQSGHFLRQQCANRTSLAQGSNLAMSTGKCQQNPQIGNTNGYVDPVAARSQMGGFNSHSFSVKPANMAPATSQNSAVNGILNHRITNQGHLPIQTQRASQNKITDPISVHTMPTDRSTVGIEYDMFGSPVDYKCNGPMPLHQPDGESPHEYLGPRNPNLSPPSVMAALRYSSQFGSQTNMVPHHPMPGGGHVPGEVPYEFYNIDPYLHGGGAPAFFGHGDMFYDFPLPPVYGMQAPFYGLRQIRRSGPANELHLRLEECYDQFKNLEKERKKTEAELARQNPGKKISSANSIPIPRLPPTPSRVDRLIVEERREHSRVITLVAKMERLRNSPLQREIHSAMEKWLDAICKVHARRRDEIINTTNRQRVGSGTRVQEDKDIIALAASIQELTKASRHARTKMWCALMMTIYYNVNPQLASAQVLPAESEDAAENNAQRSVDPDMTPAASESSANTESSANEVG